MRENSVTVNKHIKFELVMPAARSTSEQPPASLAHENPPGGNWRVTRVLERLIFPGLLACLFLLCCFPLVDTDFWWHLKTGELMWQRREIPRIDWYTYRDASAPWIDLHWGFQLLLAATHSLGGVDLVILLKGAVYTLAAAVGWRSTGSEIPTWLKGLLWTLPVTLIASRALERPEMFTVLFLAVTLWILPRAERHPGLMWGLIPVLLVWTNLHALFVLGLVVIWSFVADRTLSACCRARKNPGEPASLGPGRLWLTCGLATLACFINPYWQEGFFFPLVLLRKFTSDQALYADIGEFHRPIEFVRNFGFTHTSPLALFLLGGVTWLSFLPPLIFGPRKELLFRALLVAGFSWLGWAAQRNQNVFALTAIVVLCANLNGLWKKSPPSSAAPGERPRGTSPSIFGQIVNLIGTAATVGIVVAWIAAVTTNAWGLSKMNDGNRLFALGERRGWFAHGAAEFAKQHNLPRFAFVSNIGQAAVYTYHNGPEGKVFMDPRLEVCSPGTYQAYKDVLTQMQRGDLRWMESIRTPTGELPILILDSRNSRQEFNVLLMTAAHRWRLVFADEAAALLIDAELADTLNLPVADPRPLFYPPHY